MLVGDGSWGKVLKGESYLTGRISYASIDYELASHAGRLTALVLGKLSAYKPYWSESNGVYVVECGSKHLVETLQGALKRFETLIRQFPIRFLKGIYNAEGSVSVRSRRGGIYPRVFLTNSDCEILNLTRSLLNMLGIRTTLEVNTKAGKTKTIQGVKTATRSEVYNVCIETRENVLTLARMIGLGIPRKANLLLKAVNQMKKVCE